MVKPKIIFIFGSGHSGSTLLDMILGSSGNAFSVGELRQWNKYFHKGYQRKHPEQDFNHCTCGSKILECPFWYKINDKEKLDLENEPTNRRNVIQMALGLEDINNIDVKKKDYLKVYREIQKNIGNKTWIVDSSKSISNLLRLIKFWQRGEIELKVIGIRKHCSGVIYSHDKLPTHSWFKQLLGWPYNYIFGYQIIKRSQVPNLLIEYEDFVLNFQKYTSIISVFTGLKISMPLKLNDKTFHNIGGNPMRFKKVENIYLDEKWKRELGFFKKWLGVIMDKFVRFFN